MSSSPEFRLYDFKITNGITVKHRGAMKEFMIQMFAMNRRENSINYCSKF